MRMQEQPVTKEAVNVKESREGEMGESGERKRETL